MADQEINLQNFGDLFSQVMDTVDGALGVSAEADLSLPDNPVTPGARVKSAQDWADKMIRRAGEAADDWEKGVLSPRKHPIEAAIAANGKRKQRLMEAEREERWLKAMQRVDVDAMYHTIELVGKQAYSAGLAAREEKIRGKIGKLQPLVEALAKTIDAMPQDTDQQREARMLAARRGMIEIGKRLKGIS
jgi:uncharacterized protein YifE (UPF0438 family)